MRAVVIAADEVLAGCISDPEDGSGSDDEHIQAHMTLNAPVDLHDTHDIWPPPPKAPSLPLHPPTTPTTPTTPTPATTPMSSTYTLPTHPAPAPAVIEGNSVRARLQRKLQNRRLAEMDKPLQPGTLPRPATTTATTPATTKSKKAKGKKDKAAVADAAVAGSPLRIDVHI